MTRADLIRILMNTELEEHRNLTREQAAVQAHQSQVLPPSASTIDLRMRLGQIMWCFSVLNAHGPQRYPRAVRVWVGERLEVGPNAHLDLTWGVALRLDNAPGA